MKIATLTLAALAAAALQGCGPSTSAPGETADAAASSPADRQASSPAASMPSMTENMPGMQGAAPASQAGPFEASGKITAVSAEQVTIAHGPVEGLGWPAMTMSFAATDPTVTTGLSTGDAVKFAFRREGERYVLTEISPR